jgi:hypothetical protein
MPSRSISIGVFEDLDTAPASVLDQCGVEVSGGPPRHTFVSGSGR